MNGKLNFKLSGDYEIFSGIPKGLYSESELCSIEKRFGKKVLNDCLNKSKKKLFSSNKLVNEGKKVILNTIFETDVNKKFNMMVIGDGGFNFATGSRIFSKFENSTLYRQLGNPKEILSFSNVDGDPVIGFSKTMACTFFSEDFSNEDFGFQNRENFYVNEIGVVSSDGELLSHLTHNNFPFDPLDNMALTYKWHIRIV